MQRRLKLIVKYAFQQQLLPREYAVEERCDDVTRDLNAE